MRLTLHLLLCAVLALALATHHAAGDDDNTAPDVEPDLPLESEAEAEPRGQQHYPAADWLHLEHGMDSLEAELDAEDQGEVASRGQLSRCDRGTPNGDRADQL